MKEYIGSLEKEFSLIENGFKEEEKRTLTDYKSNNNEYAKKLAFLAYKGEMYRGQCYAGKTCRVDRNRCSLCESTDKE